MYLKLPYLLNSTSELPSGVFSDAPPVVIIPSPHTNVGATSPDLFVKEIARSVWRTAEGAEDLPMIHTAEISKSSSIGIVKVVEWTMLAGGKGGTLSLRPRGL